MRNKKSILSLFLISCFVIYSCRDDIPEGVSNTNEILTVSEAKDYFESFMELPETRAAFGKVHDGNGFSAGDFTPQWNKAVETFEHQEVSSVDIPMMAERNYIARFTGMRKVDIPVVQKLLVVKNKKNQDMSAYLMHIVPTLNCYYLNKGKV